MFKKILIVSLCLFSVPVLAAEVTVENFVRAESDHMIRANIKAFGAGVGELIHSREPTTPENQTVIRMNQDTLYSGIVLDLSEPAMFTLPVRAVNDVNLDSFANSRELSAAFVVFLGEEVTHLISLYGTHESLGRDLIPKLAVSRIMLSDGGEGDAAPLTLELWNNPHEFGCHLGKFGSKLPNKGNTPHGMGFTCTWRFVHHHSGWCSYILLHEGL